MGNLDDDHQCNVIRITNSINSLIMERRVTHEETDFFNEMVSIWELGEELENEEHEEI
jgi:hypothetical protein